MEIEDSIPDVNDDKIAGGRGKETLFKVVLRNQIDLIAIADRKANMITSFNAIFISIIITMVGAKVPVQGIPLHERSNLIIPFSILMLFCLVSAIYAIIAATPRIKKAPENANPALKSSLLFFGNFYKKSLNEYLSNMRSLLKDRNTIYEQLTIDIYYNGIVLNRKYAMLRIAYWLLMAGIVSFVGSFIIISLFGITLN